MRKWIQMDQLYVSTHQLSMGTCSKCMVMYTHKLHEKVNARYMCLSCGKMQKHSVVLIAHVAFLANILNPGGVM